MPTLTRSVASVALVLCSIAVGCAPGSSVDTYDVSEEHDAALDECGGAVFEQILERSRPFVSKGTVSDDYFLTTNNSALSMPLIDGPTIFSAIEESIANAEADVAFQTFVWEPESDAVDGILRGLARLAENRAAASVREPVTVRILVDASRLGFPSPKASSTLPAIAGAVEALSLDPKLVSVSIAAYEHTTVGNQHAKVLVVDGREAITTGANPQKHHDAGAPWHDSGYVLEGGVALGLLDDFDYVWARSKEWICGSTNGSKCMVDAAPAEHRTLAPRVADDACVPMLVIGRRPNANPFNNRTDNTQDQAYLAAFDAAESLIRIETPNLNDDHAKDALVSAIVRGVRVELVLAKKFNEKTESVPGQGGGNEENVAELYARLAKQGITDACERLVVRWYSFDGKTAVEGNGERASHTKYASIDGEVVIVGSTNMDTQSWNNAHESNVVVQDPTITRAWDQQLFEVDFERGIPASQCGGL